MIQYDDWLTHAINVATGRGYVCLASGQSFTPQMHDRVHAQIQTANTRAGYVMKVIMSAAFAGTDAGAAGAAAGFFSKWIGGLTTTREPVGEVLTELASQLQHVDLIAVRVGSLGGRFIIIVNGDQLAPDKLTQLVPVINHIGESIQTLQGTWKVQVLSRKIGKGLGMDATGYTVFAFTDPATYGRSRPRIENLKLGTSTGVRIGRAVRRTILNPLFFGGPGNVNLPTAIIRLFDPSVEVLGLGFGSGTAVWDKIYMKSDVVRSIAKYALLPQDLLPTAGSSSRKENP